jgi:uncharacterized RmlC-like cupin family protein
VDSVRNSGTGTSVVRTGARREFEAEIKAGEALHCVAYLPHHCLICNMLYTDEVIRKYLNLNKRPMGRKWLSML